LPQLAEKVLRTLVGVIVQYDRIEVFFVEAFQSTRDGRGVLRSHPHFSQDRTQQVGRILIRAHDQNAQFHDESILGAHRYQGQVTAVTETLVIWSFLTTGANLTLHCTVFVIRTLSELETERA